MGQCRLQQPQTCLIPNDRQTSDEDEESRAQKFHQTRLHKLLIPRLIPAVLYAHITDLLHLVTAQLRITHRGSWLQGEESRVNTDEECPESFWPSPPTVLDQLSCLFPQTPGWKGVVAEGLTRPDIRTEAHRKASHTCSPGHSYLWDQGPLLKAEALGGSEKWEVAWRLEKETFFLFVLSQMGRAGG